MIFAKKEEVGMSYVQGLPPLAPDEPTGEMTALDARVAEEALVKGLFEEMCQEFQIKGYGGHLLINPPRSTRVAAQAMARFKHLHPDSRAIFDSCPDETDVTDGHFTFVRRGLL